MKKNPSAYFDHEADIGIIGYGETLEQAFESAAAAVFALTTPSKIRLTHSFEIQFDEADTEIALVTWLNLLIAESESRGWALGKFQLRQQGSHWQGKAWGEIWHKDLERGTAVKGATLTMLAVKKINGDWEARCVVDV